MTVASNPQMIPEDAQPKIFNWIKIPSADPDLNDQLVMLEGASISGGNSFGENNTFGMTVAAANFLFNGTDYSPEESNQNNTLLASAVRSSTTNSNLQSNISNKGAHFAFNVTAVPGVDTVTPTIEGRDPVSLNFYTILTGPAIIATGLTILKVYPGIATIPNGAASDILPVSYRVTITHSGAGNFTYSLAESLIR